MKQSSPFLRAILILTLVLGILTSAISLLVCVLAAIDVGGEVAYRTYDRVNFPVISMVVPMAGMLLLGLAALFLLPPSRGPVTAAVSDSTEPTRSVTAPGIADAYSQAKSETLLSDSGLTFLHSGG